MSSKQGPEPTGRQRVGHPSVRLRWQTNATASQFSVNAIWHARYRLDAVAGGEGPWIRGIRRVTPGLLLAGFNAVTADTVGTAVMGYDPRAAKGSAPFHKCDNTLLLAEALGLGSADLKRIEVRGVSIAAAKYSFIA